MAGSLRLRCGLIGVVLTTAATLGAELSVPDDPLLAEQWGLHNVGQEVAGIAGTPGADVAALKAWADYYPTRPVTVAIVGTGVDPHPEFADRLLEGYAIVGDPYNSLDIGVSDPLGTYVAGVVAASRGNAVGIAGVDDTVRLLPVRVFAEGTGSEIAVAAGIVWAVDNDADVVLVPLQYYGGSQALQDAVAYAYAQGVLVIAPTGKQGYSSLAYPAAFDGCLAIAATTNRDERADFSNYGVGVDLAAPGWNVLSTWRPDTYASLEVAWNSAAAMVAGAAAMVLSHSPGLSPIEAGQVLLDSADDLGDPSFFGRGRLNIAAALTLAPAPAVRFEHVGAVPSTIEADTPAIFFVRVSDGSQAVVLGSVRLWYRTPGGAFRARVPAAAGGMYTVELPPVLCDEVVEFYLAAAGDGGTTVFDPPGGSAEPYTAHAAERVLLFADDFETAQPGWTAVAEGVNPTGLWERAVPVGTTAQPGFDRTPNAGTSCYITGQHHGGHDGTNDVDGGPVRLLSPPVAIAGEYDIEVRYAQWFHSSGDDVDEMVVEFSCDNGVSWQVADVVEPTAGWEFHSFRLGDLPGVTSDELRVRWSVADAGDPSLTEAAIDEFAVWAIRCGSSKGDFDGDGDVDLDDCAAFPECLVGPLETPGKQACAAFDYDNDGDVDLPDTAKLQRSFDVP